MGRLRLGIGHKTIDKVKRYKSNKMFVVFYSRIHRVCVDTEEVVIVVGVHGALLVRVKLCEHGAGLVQRDLGGGGALEGAGAAVLVAEEAVRRRAPVARLRHLGLEPVDRVLPLGGGGQKPLPHGGALAGRGHQALDSLVGAAAVRAVAAGHQRQQPRHAPRPALPVRGPVYHQLQPVVLQRITDALHTTPLDDNHAIFVSYHYLHDDGGQVSKLGGVGGAVELHQLLQHSHGHTAAASADLNTELVKVKHIAGCILGPP